MIGWQDSGKGIIGYRILSLYGECLYDGKLAFEGTGPFTIGTVISEGPFLTLMEPDEVTIHFKTSRESRRYSHSAPRGARIHDGRNLDRSSPSEAV